MIVSREDELDAIRRFLSSIDEGMSVRVLEGEPGAGKTTLFRAAVDIACEERIRVLQARPSRAEAELSFAVLATFSTGFWTRWGRSFPSRSYGRCEPHFSLEPPGEGTTGTAVAAGLNTAPPAAEGSASRLPDEDDTNNNAADFSLTVSTPRASNQ